MVFMANFSVISDCTVAQAPGCACAGVCAFFAVSLACTERVTLAPVHVQVFTLYRLFSTLVHMFANTPSSGRACALVYAQFAPSRWGTRVGWFS